MLDTTAFWRDRETGSEGDGGDLGGSARNVGEGAAEAYAV